MNAISKFLGKSLIALLSSIAIIFTMAACTASPQKIDMHKVTAIIDVRTPSEYAASHLEGAKNIDIEGTDFAAAVSSLDKSGSYVLYCHSGRRASMALSTMASLGFKNLTNAGSVDDASKATGLAIVH